MQKRPKSKESFSLFVETGPIDIFTVLQNVMLPHTRAKSINFQCNELKIKH